MGATVAVDTETTATGGESAGRVIGGERMAAAGGRPTSHPMDKPYRLAAGVTAVVVAVLAATWLVVLLKSLVVLFLVAGLIAAALDRPVVEVQHRLGLKRRGAEVALVALIALLVFVGIGFLIAQSIAQQGKTFEARLPAAAERLKQLPLVGSQLRHSDLRGSTVRLLHDLPKQVQGKSQVLLGVAKSAVSGLALLATTVVAAIFILLNGPSMAAGASGLIIDDDRRARAQPLGREILSAVGGYVRGNLFISLLAAMVVVVSLEIMRVPFVGVLAVIMFILDLVPLVGAAAGGAVVTLAAFLLDPHPVRVLAIQRLARSEIITGAPGKNRTCAHGLGNQCSIH